MNTRVGTARVECVVHVEGAQSAPRIQWTEGKRSARAVVRLAITTALRDAASTPDRFPHLSQTVGGRITFSFNGTRFGTDELDHLLPVLEEAAGAPGQTLVRRMGTLSVEVRWQPRSKELDTGEHTVSGLAEGASKGVAVNPLSAEERLRHLSDRLMPRVTKSDIANMERILRDAQVEPPRDPRAFADRINALLDVCALRIRTDDGDVGRLSLNPDGGLKITRARGGNRGFKNTSISLVGVDRVRVGNRHLSGDTTNQRQ